MLADGACLPLIFDDSMVNCDDDRMQGLLRILYGAAKSGLQVFVVSCHERHFKSLGEDRRINF